MMPSTASDTSLPSDRAKKGGRDPQLPKPDEVMHKKAVEEIQEKINAMKVKLVCILFFSYA